MPWRKVRLGDISRPKQWPILSKRQMSDDGYPVFGANGQIGFSSARTHARPVVLVGCRGTCGSVHLAPANSYANGNAMAIDQLRADVDVSYLAAWLRHRGFHDVTTGSSQPQITRENIVRVEVPLPPIEEQRRIADILDHADALRAKRREALAHLDDLTKSIFLDMFGDPMTNPKGLPRRAIGDIGVVITGNTPPRSDEMNYGDDIEWIKSDNLGRRMFLTRAVEGLSAKGRGLARIVGPGAVLITCIAGTPSSIGGASIADREVAFNQQINAVVLKNMDPVFFWAQLRVRRALVQHKSTGGMKGLVSKSQLQEVFVLDAPDGEQQAFGSRLSRVKGLHQVASDAADTVESLIVTLQQRAFSGLF